MAEAVIGGCMRAGGSSSEPGEEDYVTDVYNDEVNFLTIRFLDCEYSGDLNSELVRYSNAPN